MTSRPSKPLAVYLAALVFLGLTGVAFLVDLPLARFIGLEDSLPGDLVKIVDLSEIFAHGYGVFVVAMLIFTLDPVSRRCIPRLIACVALPGLVVNIIKTFVIRRRPLTWKVPPADGADAWGFDPPDSITETFQGFFAWPTDGNWDNVFDSTLRSFPSGHTAAAVGLAVGLSWLYPRGKWLFFTFAAMAAIQRMSSLSHFASDVCFGAAVSFLITAICLDSRLLGRLFDAIETGAGGKTTAQSERASDKSETV